MKWRKPPYQQFIFDSYELSSKEHAIFLRYRLDTTIWFKEVVRLPQDMVLPAKPSPLLDRALFYLHLIGGISYFKTYLPSEMVVKSGVLDKKEALFWNKLYTYGLGEFFYKNKIDFRGVVEFPYTQKEPQKKFLIKNASLPVRNDNGNTKILLPIGGGKDSLVSAELLAQSGRDFDLFTLGNHPIFERIAKKLGKKRIIVSRELSPELFKLNQQGALNGHVPISAYIALTSVVVAILKGYNHIILSNEQSSNFGNVDFYGMEINHQYSKSSEFERDFAKYIREYLTPDIHYWSLLRPFSEFQIAGLFSHYPRHFSYFSSCNRNFTITKKRGNRLFCGKCAKCAFVFAILAAFLEKKTLINIFQKNLFADEKLLPIYKKLWGIRDVKPFDCVGTPDEVITALDMARKKGEFSQDIMMQFFEKNVLLKKSQRRMAEIKDRALPWRTPHNVPKEFRDILKNAHEILRARTEIASSLVTLAPRNDRKVLLLGFGKDGKATLKVLRRFLPQQTIWIADKKTNIRVHDPRVKLILGKNYLKNLDRFDVIIKSPGIPFFPELSRVAKRVTSAEQLFFDHLDPSNTVIGVTGSKGKSTVSALLYAVLKHAGIKTRLVGNIGKPALPFWNEKNTVFVFELSSYQLERLRARAHIAIFTQFFPEHLNYHGNLQNYFSAKKNITKYQKSEDFFIFPDSVKAIHSIPTMAQKALCGNPNSFWYDKHYFYYKNTRLFPISVVKMLGKHNLQNILLVIAAAHILKIPIRKTKEAISTFRGLPHRLEYVGRFRGIDFYDDAISTTPESTLAAIDIFKEKISTIILGGEDRGYDFSELVKTLLKYRVQNIVLFPDTGRRIRAKFPKNPSMPRFFETQSMKEAVRFAYQHTPKGMICLLSTASPSYSLFKNFEEKGRLFQKYVKNFQG